MRIRKNINKEQYDEFMANNFVTCDKCGYNNHKKRFESFGTCLHCGKILDNRAYFKACMKKLSIRNPKSRGRQGLRSCLYF